MWGCLKNTVVVLQNVRFGYGGLKSECQRLGQAFSAWVLCTATFDLDSYKLVVKALLRSDAWKQVIELGALPEEPDWWLGDALEE